MKKEKYKWICITITLCFIILSSSIIIGSRGSYDLNINANKDFETAMTNLDMKPIQIENSTVIIYCTSMNESIEFQENSKVDK